MNNSNIVEAVMAGEREMYRQLMEKYQKAVFAAIIRIIGSHHEVEDLVQETFWQAYRSLGRFRGDARFSTWLVRIAKNKAIDYHRRRKHSSRSQEEYTGFIGRSRLSYEEGPEDILLAKERREQIHSCLEQLPLYYQQVLQLYYLEDLSYKEMALEAGVPLKTIESRIYRARKLFRSLFGSLETS